MLLGERIMKLSTVLIVFSMSLGWSAVYAQDSNAMIEDPVHDELRARA